MPADLDDTDKAVLAELLREVIAADRYPLSPRITKLRAIGPSPGTEAGRR